jgi:hypothetical protein
MLLTKVNTGDNNAYRQWLVGSTWAEWRRGGAFGREAHYGTETSGETQSQARGQAAATTREQESKPVEVEEYQSADAWQSSG